MAPYIISFILSLLCMYSATKTKGKWLSLLLHILAIMPPVLLLTFRAEECGTDTTNYTRYFYALDANTFGALLAATRLELLFSLLMYSVRSLNLSIECLFFICGLLTIVPVYLGAMRLRGKANPHLVMALFYLMFYQYSYNIVRQSIGMSMLFFAVVLLIENRKVWSFVFGIIAVLFHTVAVVYFIVFFAYSLRERLSFRYFISNVILVLGLVYVSQTFFSDKIEYFEDYLESSEKASTQYSYLVEMIINFLVVLFVWEKDTFRLKKFFVIVSGIVASVIMLGSVAPYAFRVANCIDISLLIYIPMALKSTRNRGYYAIYLSFAVFFWWFVFIFNHSGRSYPYVLSNMVSFI